VTFFSPILLFSPDYNVEFFRQFILVMNALDNRGKAINVSCLIASSSHGKVLELVSKCELELGRWHTPLISALGRQRQADF
jgi:hypothetical protein